MDEKIPSLPSTAGVEIVSYTKLISQVKYSLFLQNFIFLTYCGGWYFIVYTCTTSVAACYIKECKSVLLS